ncbi:DnaB-like helicase N-terminal domain-containing protein [Rhodococcus koreensis]|uniref:DnaB-like helicase N terminal domain-containing protein n=1 Tax=Rhodococcus koreensis TaxID=99653 RepID=A0A1H4I6L9_9NOCA|nr:DnaB-like helicase N-terminal domain-containing protein [Rhodococcus koreensis]SEB29406.1 DnaB-like helicase N terminal domain-containing protein [Rhodococcus koreensis]
MAAPLHLAPPVAEPVHDRDPIEHSVDVAHLDAEACCLSALMQISAAQARPIIDTLTVGDFTDSAHGALYRLIHGLIRRGQPHDYVMVAHEIDQHPGGIDHHRAQLRQHLVRVVGAATFPERAPHYAKAVVAQSYRRSFETAAQALQEATATVATDDLYEYMCRLGRRQRDAHARYAAICAATE